ncbi:outer membrane lipoprotein carrier protein LolA [Fulvivirga sp. 29W222]|uniref:Outer membrane lipoprotein carrier protein LolA n=1 Tax=Fulvivirga marina TaxID=2494733 RepID=A0A937KBP8_9BACT|nr:outer membrane lipoprotein carrier protein LolA [Fulvivirga marina]MBL6446522.1 outer membrane lipoprotein carrier protein LolA [Fulvivirga marina]
MSKLLIYLIMFPSMLLFQNDDFVSMKDIQSFKKGINQMASTTNTIQAKFNQNKYLSILSNGVESSGTMHFKKPDLLKWSYTNPYNYAILLNGEEIKINDEGKVNSFEIKNSKIFKELNDLIINSVRGNVLQEERFDISYLENNELYLTRLNPQEEQLKSYVKQIDIYFEKSDYTVNRIQLFEYEGDYTLITFHNKKINASIPDSEFSFQ